VNWYRVFKRKRLNRRRVQRPATPRRFVRLSEYGRYLMAVPYEPCERRHRELGRAHEDQFHGSFITQREGIYKAPRVDLHNPREY
jgi:hypothetical protein